MIWSSAGTWTGPGRYHHLARQPHVRHITDTLAHQLQPTVDGLRRLSGASAPPEGWHARRSNGIQSELERRSPPQLVQRRSAQPLQDGRAHFFLFRRQNRAWIARAGLDEKSLRVSVWCSLRWGHSWSEGTAASAQPVWAVQPVLRLCSLSSLVFNSVQVFWRSTARQNAAGLQEKKWEENQGGGEVRKQWVEVCSLLIALSLCQSRYDEIRASRSYQSLTFTFCPHCWLSVVYRFEAATFLFLSYSLM